jgi:hypothetical protein
MRQRPNLLVSRPTLEPRPSARHVRLGNSPPAVLSEPSAAPGVPQEPAGQVRMDGSELAAIGELERRADRIRELIPRWRARGWHDGAGVQRELLGAVESQLGVLRACRAVEIALASSGPERERASSATPVLQRQAAIDQQIAAIDATIDPGRAPAPTRDGTSCGSKEPGAGSMTPGATGSS